jgi:NitT/TauT family transport system ATP-binding protein
MEENSDLLAAESVFKSFPLPGGGEQTVLENVTRALAPGEIVAPLGRSGSGKSTLLRILAGPLQRSSGRVLLHGMRMEDSNAGVAMVFRSFALLPWLTVQENSTLGLYARGLPSEVCDKEALRTLTWWDRKALKELIPKSYRVECDSVLPKQSS